MSEQSDLIVPSIADVNFINGAPDLSQIKNLKQNIEGGYFLDDISFVNTRNFTKTAQYFQKHGVYTHAPKGSREHKQFWDKEEHRRRYGMTLPGRLEKDDKTGIYTMQEVHVTGEHYGYLNYGQIKLTKDPRDLTGFDTTGGEKVVKDLKFSGTKVTDFPAFWDYDYYYFTWKEIARMLGKHMTVGKKRRGGYSYKNGWIAANKADLTRDSITVLAAYDSSYLYPKGTMNMATNYLDFISAHTDWAKGRINDKEDYVYIGFKLPGTVGDFGYKSSIIAVSCGPNRPGAVRGKDGTLVMFEEAGKFPNLLAAYTSTKPTVEDGPYVTGQILVFGTGGDSDSNWADFEEIFYNPQLYGMMPFSNIWDEDSMDTVCSFFVPQTSCLPGFIDVHGNSDKLSGLKHELAIREDIRKNSKDGRAVTDHSMEYPLFPSEAFSRTSNNLFPTMELDAQLKKVQRDPALKYLARVGEFKRNSEGKLILDTSGDVNPILDFPLKDSTDVTGCIVEWYPPYKKNGVIPTKLYRIWHDPYAVDIDTKEIQIRHSLGAAYVYEVTNNRSAMQGDVLVASYVGRPGKMDNYNEVLFNLAEYYNAEIFFENDRGDVKPYAQKTRQLDRLVRAPEMLFAKDVMGKIGRDYGTHMNEKKKAKAAIYLRDWLTTVRATDVDTGRRILNLHTILDEALLKEFIKFGKGNFDRVSSLLVGMYDMKEIEWNESYHPEYNEPEPEDSFFNREFY